MQVNLVNLQDIGPGSGKDGATFQVSDQSIWLEPIAEFGLPCDIIEPIQAEVFLLPQADGCFIRGKLGGRVSLPCDRCAEPAEFQIEHAFEDFEPLPEDDEDGLIDSPLILVQNGKLFFNLAELLWQEFALSLPVKPLCNAGCKGVCQVCGNNLNLGACSCSEGGQDPRLAVLRNIKIS